MLVDVIEPLVVDTADVVVAPDGIVRAADVTGVDPELAALFGLE